MVREGLLVVDGYTNALGQALSNENIALLRIMDAKKPQTMTELASISGRQLSNLSATLKMLSRYGFVSLENQPIFL